MEIEQCNIPEVLLLKPKVFGDERGFFLETFRQSWFQEQGLDHQFVQDNHSSSAKGVLRGLHYQMEQTQGKLVRVVRGEVYDVAVDMRQDSPTFGQYAAAILSEENKHLFWVPPGFAHGFLVLSEMAEFVYKCTDYYHPESEASLRWDDPTVAIDWPLSQYGISAPSLSDKDKDGFLLPDAPTFDSRKF
ncbi:dTDP-4-dehydrorhamnose 3,5-epimerase [uncultured Pseudoteredinibacter sp.]|uniref:dTDP-4-dehydrorhamnose 3,5-epimerase n=1 Tax=uncultured Pseudoteredinibacter sp. TaxID=1641701 RepID=UPI0026112757|nr:dTDP-4-dehydrorhamnose 3,5-epimerase [uncultured Pseudoteredinibacter sp.]